MEDINIIIEDDVPTVPRRSRRLALAELNDSVSSLESPDKAPSPDELVIIQRGPRRKPMTWSPVSYEFDKVHLASPKDKTPDKKFNNNKSEINSKLRRRLILSPSKQSSSELGLYIAKKLRAMQKNTEKSLQ